MEYLPILTICVFNASLGLILIDFSILINYWKYCPRYAALITGTLVLSFFTNLLLAMLLGLLIFFLIYMQSNSLNTFTLGDPNELLHLAKEHDMLQTKRRKSVKF